MATNIKVVIGCNAGDEGKGLATDYFALKPFINKENCLVVLSNGGSQRGHTVTLPSGDRHVFRHFGSATFLDGYTYLPKYYIVNPMNWAKEANDLKNKGVIPYLFINKDCPLTTPFDMVANQLIETARGEDRHGSCGVGIWETILRNGITVGEMAVKTTNEKIEYLKFVRDEYFRKRISSKGVKLDNDWESVIYSQSFIDNYIYDFNLMMRCSMFVDDSILKGFKNIIFENGQGLLIDQRFGKHSTPSNTGLKNPADIINSVYKDSDDIDVEVCYITRTYLTRHGVGAFDTECDVSKIGGKIGEDKTNKYHEFQGRLRYGVLDWGELEKRCKNDFNKFSNPNWIMSYFITHKNELCDVPDSILCNNKTYHSHGFTRRSVYESIRN